jgi:hypothetical protein
MEEREPMTRKEFLSKDRLPELPRRLPSATKAKKFPTFCRERSGRA